jgi:tRNA threonylcarbamoyladenosine biosynthesis protein TsaB
MKILAIDTSQKTVSVSILEDDVLRADIFINSGRHHSEILLTAIEQVLCLAGLQPDDVNLFAVTIGPGSFTGLRIGAATVKGLALSTGKPVVGVSTLAALSLNAASAGQPLICPMLDAQKNQVYTALYRLPNGADMEIVREEQLIDVDTWLQELEGDILFLGDGAVKYSQGIKTHFASAACIAEGSQNHIQAATVAVLARDKFQRGEELDLLRFTPYYLRAPEAEVRIRQKTSGIDKHQDFR